MDNALQVFNYNSHEVRTVEKNGDIWFVAKDVCDVLEHSNSRMAVQNLDDDEKDVSKVYTPSGEQDMTIISESGVYALVLRSNKPEAKEFSRWVRKEVLPQIRKTGQFSIKKELAALPAGVIDGAKTILEVIVFNILAFIIGYFMGKY